MPTLEPDRRIRLTLDLPTELHLRLKLFATYRRLTMRELVEALLDHELPPLERLSGPQPLDMSRLPAISADTRRRFEETRAHVMRGRTYATDSASLLREARDEAEARLDAPGDNTASSGSTTSAGRAI